MVFLVRQIKLLLDAGGFRQHEQKGISSVRRGGGWIHRNRWSATNQRARVRAKEKRQPNLSLALASLKRSPKKEKKKAEGRHDLNEPGRLTSAWHGIHLFFLSSSFFFFFLLLTGRSSFALRLSFIHLINY
jgi:hypothetical protein